MPRERRRKERSVYKKIIARTRANCKLHTYLLIIDQNIRFRRCVLKRKSLSRRGAERKYKRAYRKYTDKITKYV